MEVKSFQELPFETLFKMAEEKYESLQYEEAEYFYQLAYKKNSQDEVLVMCYASLLKKVQKSEQAKVILEKSLLQVPSGSYKRYMELAQIYGGVKSIQIFERGIAEASKCLSNPFKSVCPQAEIKRDIAQAYASIADVCMTDLLEEKEAEAKCKQAMDKGRKMDSYCIDVRLQIANYLMWNDNFEQAKLEMVQVYGWIMEDRQEYETQTVIQAGKHLIQVEQLQKALDVYQKIHDDASSECEIVYMLAYICFKMKNWLSCEEYLEEYQQNKLNGGVMDEQVDDAIKDMKGQLAKKLNKQVPVAEDDEWMDVESDSF